jgi:hypothetical protein
VFRSTEQFCRYLFYLGRIRAIQLEYTEAKDCLQQAARKVWRKCPYMFMEDCTRNGSEINGGRYDMISLAGSTLKVRSGLGYAVGFTKLFGQTARNSCNHSCIMHVRTQM